MVDVDNKSILPFVSVVMPVRQEGGTIKRSLSAVLAQDYPASRLEIIVVDGMSDDDTRHVVQQFQRLHPFVNLIDNPGLIVPTGLNAAMRRAKGDIIVRVDGHCEIAPDYISKCVGYISTGEVDVVGGSLETVGETPHAETIALGMSSPFGVGNSAFRTIQGRTLLTDTVPFAAYTRKIIEKIGLYDEELIRNQDDEYNYRIREAGGKILLGSDLRTRYYSRASLSGLWQQYFQYGYWKVRVLQKHFRQMRLRQFIPPVFVASLLAASGLALITPIGFYLLILITGSYLIANLFASMMEGLKSGKRHILWLPIVYLTLHLSYGSGFLVGLIRFANRWGDKRGKVPELLLGE